MLVSKEIQQGNQRKLGNKPLVQSNVNGKEHRDESLNAESLCQLLATMIILCIQGLLFPTNDDY